MRVKSLSAFILTVVFALVFAVAASAAPLRNLPVTVTQPDGTTLDIFASGDEFFNYYHDADGNFIRQDSDGWYCYCREENGEIVANGERVTKTAKVSGGLKIGESVEIISEKTDIGRQAMSVPVHSDYNTEAIDGLTTNASYFNMENGSIENIVIYICFSDEEIGIDETKAGMFDDVYNSGFTSSPHNDPVSVQAYFNKTTGGHIDVRTSFYPKDENGKVYYYRDNHPRSYYKIYNSTLNPNGYTNDSQRTNREFTLLKNAVDAVKEQIPSTLNLDNNEDGIVDSIMFIVTGPSEGWGDLLWAHQWSLYYKDTYIGNKLVYDFAFTFFDEAFYSDSTIFVGTICHEMMHVFGFPDLYDYVNQSNKPIYDFDIMASNTYVPNQPTVYTKSRWGKISATESWISDSVIQTLDSPLRQHITLNVASDLANPNGKPIALVVPSEFTGYGDRDIYIEYRGDDGIYSTSNRRYYIDGAFYTGTTPGYSSGLLVYEVDDYLDDNMRSGLSSSADKSEYCVWAYRQLNYATFMPDTFYEGSYYVGLNDDYVLIIENIVQAEDKMSVEFDISIKVNGEVTASAVSDDGDYWLVNSNTTVSSYISSLTRGFTADTTKLYNETPGLATYSAEVYDADGNLCSDTQIIGTGYKVDIHYLGNGICDSTTSLVLPGDVNGDTSIDIDDCKLVILNTLGSRPLTGAYAKASQLAAGVDSPKVSVVSAIRIVKTVAEKLQMAE